MIHRRAAEVAEKKLSTNRTNQSVDLISYSWEFVRFVDTVFSATSAPRRRILYFPEDEVSAMNYDVRLETILTPLPLAVVRRRASARQLAQVVPDACGVVWGVIRAQQVKGAGRHVAIYLDSQINLEIGVELETPFAGHGEVVGSALPTGTVATTVHFGPYHRLHEAHQAIRDWCADHGHSLAGPNWEIYGHWQEAWNNDPARIRTDVFYLLTASGKTVG